MRNRVITLILLTCTLAMGLEAARFDEPAPLTPDSQVSEGTPETTPRLPVGTPAVVSRSADNLPNKLPAGDLRWFKGNTHTHSLWSDGNDFPEMIADWYKSHGYNFLVLSDHNTLSAGERWMKVTDVEKRKRVPGPPVMPKYVARFGGEWVETRGEGANEEVRLRALAEVRPKFEEPEKFLMIEGDEMNFDIANTLRLTRLKSEPLYALATDDSHNYHGGDASPGRGWVMVRAASLRAEDLIAAMRAGDFYASSGVTLKDLRFDAATGELRIEIEPDGDATYVTRFIGTLAAEPENCGQVLATDPGLVAAYKLTGAELYVRATVTSSLAHANPSFKGQQRQAWTQPVGWKKAQP